MYLMITSESLNYMNLCKSFYINEPILNYLIYNIKITNEHPICVCRKYRKYRCTLISGKEYDEANLSFELCY